MVAIFFAVFCCCCCNFPIALATTTAAAAAAAPASFESQFSNTVYYGLAIAGMSLGCAIAVALLGLLIFCLVRRRRKKHGKLTRSDTEASTASSGQQHQQKLQTAALGGRPAAGTAATNFGPMALPVVSTKDVGGGGTAGSGGRRHRVTDNGTAPAAASDGGGGASSSKASSIDAGRAQYTNRAFNPNESTGGLGGSGGGQLFRHSSFLRPVSYASLESNKSREHFTPAAAPAAGPVTALATQHHPVVRTSPATTLDPRYFFSHDGGINLQLQQQQQQQQLQQQQKRMSLAEKNSSSSPGIVRHHQQQPQQQQSQYKRMSYADSSNSNVSFGSPHQQQQQQATTQQRFVAIAGPTLPTQPEAVARKTRQAPGPPPPSAEQQHQQQLEEGPSFPRVMKNASPSSSPAEQQQQPVKKQQSLHRIQLGSGGDSRSVASTVLKQEAIKAFEFLEGYD